MTADDPTILASRVAQPLRHARQRLRPLARRVLWTVARPYARRRARRAESIARLGRVESTLEHLGERQGEQIERLEDLVRELVVTAESLRRSVSDVDTAMKTEARSAERQIELITSELNALPYMADSPFQCLPSPVGEVLGYRSSTPMRTGDSDYVDFEELFRGSTERVANSQRPYVALVRDHAPVLDVGCGRGEFLGLLAGEGISAYGVDSDAGMVSRCRALGLEASLADANEHLASLQDGDLGTVFSAQLIEHLPHAELRRMLALALCKLRPGGLFIAETVNPHRVSSLKTFWVDPTHQHPIFPEVALALCAIAGFESAYVFAPGFESFDRARFQAPAYAVVATPSQSGGED
jgi:2-polyprenyl-3-methyl-5-hydroxy-6-metoxy-1,4-benzoquinol methylase